MSPGPSWRRRLFVPWVVFTVAFALMALAAERRRPASTGPEGRLT